MNLLASETARLQLGENQRVAAFLPLVQLAQLLLLEQLLLKQLLLLLLLLFLLLLVLFL